jgi:ribulose-phosphate 3-epimerase
MIDLAKTRCVVEVDGGIDPETAPSAVTAGADVLVAGTAIFNEGETVAVAIDRLRDSPAVASPSRVVATGARSRLCKLE